MSIDTGWCLFLDVAAETVSGSLSNWTGAGNAILNNSSRASNILPEGYPTESVSEKIKFTNPDLPTIGPAVAYNVDFRIKRVAGGGGHFIADELVQMIINGSASGNNLGETTVKWSGAETKDYDGDWGIAFLQSMFNANLGVVVQVSDTDSGGTAEIETVWLRVQYDQIAGPVARESIQYS